MRAPWPALLLLLVQTAALADDGEPEGPTYPSLKLGGFTDINFFVTDDDAADPKSGFKEGQFTLHFSSALAARVSFFAEVTLNARSDETKIDLERSIVKYDHSDVFKLSLGKYHTPINWWNVAFHHGQWLQTTVSRPEMTQFGGEFIPVHFVGALAEGSIPAGGINLGYRLGAGNGRGSVLTRGGDAGDVNDSRAWLANLYVRPDAAYALQAGVAYYDDRLTIARDDAEQELDETIVSAFVVWTKETPEVLAEYARSTREDRATGQQFDASAFYVQLAYRLPVLHEKLKPYVRYEKIETEGGDPLFSKLTDRDGVLGGVRYDFSDYVAIKLEYKSQEIAGGDAIGTGSLQVALAF